MGNSLTSVQLGFLVGAVPTAAMLLSSLAFTSFEVNKYVEATFQNFAAGLILAAVAAELFPLMITEVSPQQTFIGVTVGFIVGLGVLNGLEVVIEHFSGDEENDEKRAAEKTESEKFKVSEMREMIVSRMTSTTELLQEGGGKVMNEEFVRVNVNDVDQTKEVELSNTNVRISKSSIEEEFHELYKGEAGTPRDWEEDEVQNASLALAVPQHRSHLHEHVQEVVDTIALMEQQCSRLLDDSIPKTRSEAEQLAEEIDERTHNLQYKLDHCRRLLQGSEVEVAGVSIGYTKVPAEKKKAIERRLELLKLTGEHLIEHLSEEEINSETLKEMHQHMEDMDQIINTFHSTVENVACKWRRRYRDLPEPDQGDTLPVGLVIPVTLDCFADGFLIGVSCALSPGAGIILGFANCLEMGFLGMAYSIRLTKCTGSSWLARQTTLILPPLLMFLSAGLGAFVAAAASGTPAVFVGFVAFGVVVLLSLVCGELLIEARECMGEEEVWFVTLSLYAAVYLVIMLTRVF